MTEETETTASATETTASATADPAAMGNPPDVPAHEIEAAREAGKTHARQGGNRDNNRFGADTPKGKAFTEAFDSETDAIAAEARDRLEDGE